MWVDFKEVKAKTTMLQVLEHYGIKLKRVNANSYRGDCPLPQHKSDTKGSFAVNTEKNIWSCPSGSCKENRGGKTGGNVLDFVAWKEEVSVREAALSISNWEAPKESVNDKAEGYMAELDRFIRGLLIKEPDWTHEVWEEKLVKAIKRRVLESYRAGREAALKA